MTTQTIKETIAVANNLNCDLTKTIAKYTETEGYILSQGMIQLGDGNGLFIRQQQPDAIADGKIIITNSDRKFKWQYQGRGNKNLKPGYAPSIEDALYAFLAATNTTAKIAA